MTDFLFPKLEISTNRNCTSEGAINIIVFLMKVLLKSDKKWTLKIQKSKIVILVLNQSPISAVFSIVRFPGDPKTALTGDPLYVVVLVLVGTHSKNRL